jgi:hypothetical protein
MTYYRVLCQHKKSNYNGKALKMEVAIFGLLINY